MLKKKVAYISHNGDVYFSVRHFATYGALAHQDIEKLRTGTRVSVMDMTAKSDSLDFVLDCGNGGCAGSLARRVLGLHEVLAELFQHFGVKSWRDWCRGQHLHRKTCLRAELLDGFNNAADVFVSEQDRLQHLFFRHFPGKAFDHGDR